jgi:hypothetical protein
MKIEGLINSTPNEQSPLIQPDKPDAILSLLESLPVEIVILHLMPMLSPKEYGLLRCCSTYLSQIREKRLESKLTTSMFKRDMSARRPNDWSWELLHKLRIMDTLLDRGANIPYGSESFITLLTDIYNHRLSLVFLLHGGLPIFNLLRQDPKVERIIHGKGNPSKVISSFIHDNYTWPPIYLASVTSLAYILYNDSILLSQSLSNDYSLQYLIFLKLRVSIESILSCVVILSMRYFFAI